MKMILASIPDDDNSEVSKNLIGAGYRVTTIASTGSFLRSGTSTLMVGVEDEKVDDAIEIIKGCCCPSTDPGLKRGSIFVLNVANFQQI